MHHRRHGYDVVHVVHGTFPEDPRVRREATVAAEVAPRVVVIALHQPNRARAGHHGRIRIVRVPGSKSRGSALDYVREYLGFTLRVFVLFAKDDRFRRARVVHVHTLPDFLIFGALPAIRAGARSILDLHEIFPEFVKSKFRGAAGATVGWIARRLERASRARATITITVNRPIQALLSSRPARRNERIEVVHNVPDPRDIGEAVPRSYEVAGPARCVYHGTLTHLYGLDIAIESIALARDMGVAATLDIYGDGPARPELEALVSRSRAERLVTFHGSVSHTRLRRDLQSFDAGLIPTRLDAMTRYSLSTKLLELFHLGIPVIASRIPTYVTYFPETCAWYFEPNDTRSAAEAIAAFVGCTDGERRARVMAAADAANRVGWREESAHLASIYRDLLAR